MLKAPKFWYKKKDTIYSGSDLFNCTFSSTTQKWTKATHGLNNGNIIIISNFNKNKNFWYEFFNFINNAKVGSSFVLDSGIKSLKDRDAIFLFDSKIIQRDNRKLRIKKKENWL